MKIKPDSYMFEMIRTELTDVVGDEYVDVKFADKFGHSIDYYWIPVAAPARRAGRFRSTTESSST